MGFNFFFFLLPNTPVCFHSICTPTIFSPIKYSKILGKKKKQKKNGNLRDNSSLSYYDDDDFDDDDDDDFDDEKDGRHL